VREDRGQRTEEERERASESSLGAMPPVSLHGCLKVFIDNLCVRATSFLRLQSVADSFLDFRVKLLESACVTVLRPAPSRMDSVKWK
jgi:hypothetical protein